MIRLPSTPIAAARTTTMAPPFDLLANLNILGFETRSGRDFRTIEAVPARITERFPALATGQVDLAAEFPFLESFLDDAEQYWQGEDVEPLKSGFWTQPDRHGQDCLLEATAVRDTDGDRRVLLLELFGGKLGDLRQILQSAREQKLAHERLEKLHRTLNETSLELHRVAEERREALDLSRQLREQLEQRVAERTSDLVDANRRLEEEIRQRRHANERLLVYQEQLRSLADQLTVAEAQERRRVAEYLHDRIGQSLAVTKINLGMLGSLVQEEAAKSKLTDVLGIVEELIADTRGLTFDLGSPVLYELGLRSALESVMTRFEQNHGIAAEFEHDGGTTDLPENRRLVIYQAVRELLHNVVKHADTPRVRIDMNERGGFMEVVVTDFGRGFDSDAHEFEVSETGGFGLFNVAERLDHMGGSCEIHSQPGAGTRVVLRAPMTDTEHGESK